MSLDTTANTINIKLMDDTIIPFNSDVAKQSILIKNITEDIESSDDIPINNEACTQEIMGKIKIFLEYIYFNQTEKEQLEEFNNSRGNTPISQWFTEFINLDKQIIFNLIIAADYLDIKCLLDFGCWAVANKIKNLNPEEIKEMFSQK